MKLSPPRPCDNSKLGIVAVASPEAPASWEAQNHVARARTEYQSLHQLMAGISETLEDVQRENVRLRQDTDRRFEALSLEMRYQAWELRTTHEALLLIYVYDAWAHRCPAFSAQSERYLRSVSGRRHYVAHPYGGASFPQLKATDSCCIRSSAIRVYPPPRDTQPDTAHMSAIEDRADAVLGKCDILWHVARFVQTGPSLMAMHAVSRVWHRTQRRRELRLT